MTPEQRARIYKLPCYEAFASLMAEELIAEIEAYLAKEAS